MFTIFTFANNSFALLTRNLGCLVDGVADLANERGLCKRKCLGFPSLFHACGEGFHQRATRSRQ